MLYWESIIWPRHKALQKTWYRLHHLRLQQDRTLVSRRGVGSFLGGLCLDNGEGANVEQVHVRKALDKIFTTNFPPKTHMLFSMATFPSCTNRALKKNDHTPVRNQTGLVSHRGVVVFFQRSIRARREGCHAEQHVCFWGEVCCKYLVESFPNMHLFNVGPLSVVETKTAEKRSHTSARNQSAVLL